MKNTLGLGMFLGLMAASTLVANAGEDGDETRKVIIEPHLETYGYLSRVAAETQLERGAQVYVQWCAICHNKGVGMAGTDFLRMKYKGEVSPLLEERTDLTRDVIEYYVREGLGSMPYFRKTEVSDSDLDALVLHLTSKNKQQETGS